MAKNKTKTIIFEGPSYEGEGIFSTKLRTEIPLIASISFSFTACEVRKKNGIFHFKNIF